MLSLLLFLLLYFPLCTTIDLGVTKGGRWWLALLSSFRLGRDERGNVYGNV